jgi:2'-5' RNA ligase
VRTFVAIELSDTLKDRIRGRMDQGMRSLPKARWVNPELLHLTLVFLGETAESDLVTMQAALSETFLRSREFDLELSGGGTFPARRAARVAWIGAEGGESLLVLQKEVAAAMHQVLGRNTEKRPFHAHVTLARCRHPWKRYAVDRYLDLMSDFEARVRVVEGVLMASELGKSGSRYTRVCKFSLGGTRSA